MQNCCVWVASKLTPHHHLGCWQPLLWPPGTWPPLTEPLSALLRQPICLKTGSTCSTCIQCFFIWQHRQTDYMFRKSLHIKYISHTSRTYISHVTYSPVYEVWNQTKEWVEKISLRWTINIRPLSWAFIVWTLTGEFPQQENTLVHWLLRKKTHTQQTFFI